jgi:thiol-disulfide isomerase/thioredoxin
MSILLGVGLAASIVLAACAPPGRTDTAPFPTISARPNAAAVPPATRSNSNNLATDFPITVYQGQKVLGGQQIDLANLLSQGKPVVLNFWAGLCPPCRLEMPDLQAAYDEYQDGVLLFGLDVGVFTGLGSQEDGRALLQELEITYPAGTTSDAGVVREYQVIGMPTTYFITPDGHIVQKWTGLLTRDKLVELIGELLEASESS